MKKEIKQQVHSIEYEGNMINVLHVDGMHEDIGESGVCALCGFKVRKGNHSWMVQMSNGMAGINADNGIVLLPTDMFLDGIDPHQMSLGFFEIGAECRKQLPSEFVVKWSNVVSA